MAAGSTPAGSTQAPRQLADLNNWGLPMKELDLRQALIATTGDARLHFYEHSGPNQRTMTVRQLTEEGLITRVTSIRGTYGIERGWRSRVRVSGVIHLIEADRRLRQAGVGWLKPLGVAKKQAESADYRLIDLWMPVTLVFGASSARERRSSLGRFVDDLVLKVDGCTGPTMQTMSEHREQAPCCRKFFVEACQTRGMVRLSGAFSVRDFSGFNEVNQYMAERQLGFIKPEGQPDAAFLPAWWGNGAGTETVSVPSYS